MPSGPRLFLENGCYHIMIRGNNKKKIFHASNDYKHYISLIKKYKKRYKIKVFGYCLMPNHIHIIIQPEKDKRDVSGYMQSLSRAYTAYFNESYKEVGHLWQGRYKSKVVLKDGYMLNLISYLEQNPVRARIVDAPHHYAWSSYRERNLLEWIGIIDEPDIAGTLSCSE